MNWRDILEPKFMALHFLSWAFFACHFTYAFRPSFSVLVNFALIGSILWECFEEWRGWYEHPANRLFVDPVTNTAGAITGWALLTYVIHI